MRTIFIAYICLALVGCAASVGTMPHTIETRTDLTKSNFRVIESGIQGQSKGFNLLGFIPIVSPTYGKAMADLHSKVEMKGKARALANVSQDNSTLYLILFSLPRLTISADVVEFLEE